MTKTLYSLYRYFIFVFAILTISFNLVAQTETLSTGSFIINMGATNPNSIGNGLKPYGLIYDLIRNNSVPIKWVIGAGKIKDGIDFTYNGVQYRGGTFIIPAQYRSAAVNTKISTWQGQGVVGTTTISPLTVYVTQTLNAAPRWTLDAANGVISESYLINAGITNTAFPGAYNWKLVQTLGSCDDFFVMPHADPTWATHSNLYAWNQNSLGSIWAACHAVSALENCINPGNTTQQMNFLSTRTSAVAPTPWPNNSLTLWNSHTDGSVPYTHQFFDDPIAQYMGTTDAALLNGSEQIYLPRQGVAPNNTRWRPGVKIITYDPTQANVTAPNLANGNIAALMLYGRAFDDPGRGYVMYEAGHTHNKGTAADVAAQRAFFNFSFFQVQPKVPNITVTGLTSGQNINGGTVTNVSVSATSPLIGVTFSYLWTSSCGGTFANPTAATTTFTAPVVAGPTPCVLTCKVSDNCGRTSFQSFPVTILAGPQPPVPAPDNASVSVTCGTGTSVTTNVLTNDADPGGLPLTLTNVTGALNGTVSFTAAGNVTFTPNANFTGPLVLTYTVCNNATPVPLCANSTLTISTTGGSTPAAAADAFTIAEDAVGRFNVLANDAGGLTVIGITAGPTNGRVSINTDNTITYVPNADFGGPTDNFTYRVTNGTGGFNTATVTVTVTNDDCNGGTFQSTPASVVNTTITTTKATIIYQGDNTRNYGSCTVIGFEPDNNFRDNSLVEFDLSSIPPGATITGATLRLVHQVGVFGEGGDPFTVNVRRLTRAWVEGTACDANQPGSATWNSAGSINWTTPGGDFAATNYGSFTGGAADANGTVYTVNVLTLVNEWYTSAFSNFGFMLQSGADPNGGDEFWYVASDDFATAADRPRLIISYSLPAVCSAIPTRAPMALPDTATTQNGVAVNIATVTNDFFPVGGAVTYSIITAPVSGTASINGSGVVNYTPATTFNGVRSLTYRVNHTASGLSDTATVYINITNGPIDAVNDAPAGALSGIVQTINVKANDTDPEGAVATATVSITTAPKNGTATVDGSNNIVYTPNVGFTGSDTLFYTLCEPAPTCGSSICDTARLIVTVINRPPVANPVFRTILPCYANTFTLITSASDPEIGVLTISSLSALSNPAAGTLVNNNDGTVTFTPATGFLGVVTFTYTVTDDGITPQTSAPATVTITVLNPVNNPPIAVNDVEDTYIDQVLYANVRENDSDPDNNPLTIPTITVAPLHGTAVVNPINGQIEYIPNPGYFGTDVLTYRICDIPIIIVATCTSGPDLCATATLTITVNRPFNPLPVTLASFTGIASKCDAVLQWKTSLEISSDKFVVEQSSNGLNFTAVAEVKSANSANGRSYQVSVSQPNSVKYYRLKSVDIDGRFSYSPVITVRNNCTGTDYMSVNPNPVSTKLTVSFQTTYKGQANLVIVNAVGQQLAAQQIQITIAANTINLDMSNYAPGMYMLYLADDSGTKIGEVQKVIKN